MEHSTAWTGERMDAMLLDNSRRLPGVGADDGRTATGCSLAWDHRCIAQCYGSRAPRGHMRSAPPRQLHCWPWLTIPQIAGLPAKPSRLPRAAACLGSRSSTRLGALRLRFERCGGRLLSNGAAPKRVAGVQRVPATGRGRWGNQGEKGQSGRDGSHAGLEAGLLCMPGWACCACCCLGHGHPEGHASTAQ